jgi:hypothetical protein
MQNFEAIILNTPNTFSLSWQLVIECSFIVECASLIRPYDIWHKQKGFIHHKVKWKSFIVAGWW